MKKSTIAIIEIVSEAWGPPQFQEKRSWSEKAILGALGEFRGILEATLGIQNSILGIRNSILGMASHDWSNMKTTILGATPGAIPGIHGNPHERFSFAPAFSERFFKNWGGPRAPDCKKTVAQWQAILGAALKIAGSSHRGSCAMSRPQQPADTELEAKKLGTF